LNGIHGGNIYMLRGMPWKSALQLDSVVIFRNSNMYKAIIENIHQLYVIIWSNCNKRKINPFFVHLLEKLEMVKTAAPSRVQQGPVSTHLSGNAILRQSRQYCFDK